LPVQFWHVFVFRSHAPGQRVELVAVHSTQPLLSERHAGSSAVGQTLTPGAGVVPKSSVQFWQPPLTQTGMPEGHWQVVVALGVQPEPHA
jgi:hypothetical protein